MVAIFTAIVFVSLRSDVSVYTVHTSKQCLRNGRFNLTLNPLFVPGAHMNMSLLKWAGLDTWFTADLLGLFKP